MYAEMAADGLEAYARAAGALVGLPIRDEWWPAVVTNLGVLLEQANLLADGPGADQEVPAPVFIP
jgi:hypothetical protein